MLFSFGKQDCCLPDSCPGHALQEHKGLWNSGSNPWHLMERLRPIAEKSILELVWESKQGNFTPVLPFCNSFGKGLGRFGLS